MWLLQYPCVVKVRGASVCVCKTHMVILRVLIKQVLRLIFHFCFLRRSSLALSQGFCASSLTTGIRTGIKMLQTPKVLVPQRT